MLRPIALVVLAAAAGLACATPQTVAPISAGPAVPGAGEQVKVDQLLVVIDSSASIDRNELFPQQKALVESFANSAPEGSYEAGTIAFGGFRRQSDDLARFERTRLQSDATQLRHLSEGTPLYKVFAEAGEALKGKSGQAAVVIFSDGLPTDEVGRDVAPEVSLEAARALASGYNGELCFHTVQTGDDPAGAKFLMDLSHVTSCGSYRTRASITNVASLHALQRDVFFGGGLPAVAAAPGDRDRDGVIDAKDECPLTPGGAKVDARGCWVISSQNFAFDSDVLQPRYDEDLDAVVKVLSENPDVRVRIDGHTDSTGSAAYNRGLSERRAAAVRNKLVQKGVSASRLEVKGWGAGSPAYPNDTKDNRFRNRRTEITVVR